MKARLLPLIVVIGCASTPPVEFIYKGMKRDLMLKVMGEPAQILTTYQGKGNQMEDARLYQFSNAKCERERKAVCSVSVTKEGIVYGWEGIKTMYTEDGQN